MTANAEAPAIYTGVMFTVQEGKTLTLENVVVDGGAIWTGEINPVLQRGTVNAGITVDKALVVTEKNATIILGEGAVLQNNDGANAVNLGTRTGGKLIVNGGSIYGIDSNGGSAIWQYGGDITINGGLIEQKAEGTYNFAINGLGGTVTVTGGKIAGNHGAIATQATAVVLNDGEFVCTGTAGMTDNVLYSDGSGTIIIYGGTFTADNDVPAGGCCVYDANGGVTINGGVFGNSSGGDVWGTTGTTIKGGKFENLIETSHIAEGYEMNANGEVVAK
jgi:hypothetical protein